MFRKTVPLAVAIVLVLGCKKKEEGESGGGGQQNEPNTPTLTTASNTTYAIKLRKEQKGDKYRRSRSYIFTLTQDGKVQPRGVQQKDDYTATVVESEDAAGKPSKLICVFTTAERAEEGGPFKPLAYAGKTVIIEKKGGAVRASADGKEFAGEEAALLNDHFRRLDKFKTAAYLPKQPVKVGENWTADQGELANWSPSPSSSIDIAKSAITGQFTKVYSKDGKQWGVIVLRIDLVTAENPERKDGARVKVTGETTLETPIDDSAYEGTTKSNRTTVMTYNIAGKSRELTTTSTEDEVVTPVK